MRTQHVLLSVAIVSLIVTGLAVFVHPLIWAQVDTSEGGGEEYQELEYGRAPTEDRVEGRFRTPEDWQSMYLRWEEEYLKDRIRETQLIQAQHSKLDSLEERVQALESLQHKVDSLEMRVLVLESLQRLDTPPSPAPSDLNAPAANATRSGTRLKSSPHANRAFTRSDSTGTASAGRP